MSGEKGEKELGTRRYQNNNLGPGLQYGQLAKFPQKGLPPVELTMYGTENYTLFEDRRGFTAVYCVKRKVWCYATLDQYGRFEAAAPLSEPVPPGLRRKLRESTAVVKERIEENEERKKQDEAALALLEQAKSNPEKGERTFGPDDGLLSGPKIFRGKVKGLTVLVEFADETFQDTLGIDGDDLAKEVDALLNGQGYNKYGNSYSVRTYYALMSNKKLDYTNLVIGPIKVEGTKTEYSFDRDIVAETLQALQDLENEGTLDPTQFDYGERGLVSALNILYAGEAVFVQNSMLWPHNAAYIDRRGNPLFTFAKSRVQVYYYLLTDLSELVIGTICHENGHLLFRFPDLYTYGNRDGENRGPRASSGIGRYCLMGAGNYNNERKAPCAVSAYLRELAGWTDKVVRLDRNLGKTVTIPHGDYTTVYKWPISENEYFLVENRLADGLDAYLPSHGLAVFHCDRKGSNEWVQGTKEKHFQLALLQADGELNLEKGKNQGDSRDLFSENQLLNDSTAPSTRGWGNVRTDFAISNIHFNADKSISFTVGKGTSRRDGDRAPPPSLVQVYKKSTPKEPQIPDNWSLGITDSIEVTESGMCRQALVGVNILHNRVSDLYVALTTPSGKHFVLHNRVASDKPNLRKTWDLTGQLTSEDAKGYWVLEVSDNGAEEDGYLHDWYVDLKVQP